MKKLVKLFSFKALAVVFALSFIAFTGNAQEEEASPTASVISSLKKGSKLEVDGSLTSTNHKFVLTMTSNGLTLSQTGKVLWRSAKAGASGAMNQLIFDAKGNLVAKCLTTNCTEWQINVNNTNAAELKLQDDGNLLIYDRNNKALWALKNPNGGDYESPVGYLLN